MRPTTEATLSERNRKIQEATNRWVVDQITKNLPRLKQIYKKVLGNKLAMAKHPNESNPHDTLIFSADFENSTEGELFLLDRVYQNTVSEIESALSAFRNMPVVHYTVRESIFFSYAEPLEE